MSSEKIVYSRYSIYLMANPDATKKEFLEETGATVKDWYNSKARVAGLTLRDKGIGLPRSKSIVWLMVHPESTKAEYVKAGFHPDSYMQNCNRAIELLQHCGAARSLLDPLIRTVNMRSRAVDDQLKRKPKLASLFKEPMVQRPLNLPKPKLSLEDYWLSDSGEKLTPTPEMIPDLKVNVDTRFDFKPSPLLDPKPYKPFRDSSDIELRLKSAVDEMMTELREQQQKSETYRARITALNAENFRLRAEVSELTEMINGPTRNATSI
jgi:hypothetical protein